MSEHMCAGLRLLREAVEIMDQKVTPFGERDDGTIAAYIVADSTWHRVLAAARQSEVDAALVGEVGLGSRPAADTQ